MCLLVSGIGVAQAWTEVAATVPTTAAAFDAARQRLLLAGTDTQQRLHEWDGSRVRERVGALAGERTVQHLVYDPGARRMLALASDRFVGTWDGGAWSWHRGGTPPPGNEASSVAFDSFRRRLVVVPATTPYMYEWDGQQWWAIPMVRATGIEGGATFAFDPISRRCVLCGGGSSSYASTWTWDGFAWTLAMTNVALGPRRFASLALDPVRGTLVLYGGSPTATDTWSWSGSAWTQVPTTNDPGPQSGAHLVGDQAGLLLVATQGTRAGEVWRLAGTAWTRVGLLPVAPPSHFGSTLAFDAVRGHLVGFGGDLATSTPQTFLFDRRWTQTRPTTSPPARHFAQLAWSDVDQKVLLFGGLTLNLVVFGDTWLWNGSDWEPRQPAHSPAPRSQGVLARDPAGGVMLFGGWNEVVRLGDHWRWDGTDWHQQQPGVVPAPRATSVFAHDPVRNEVVVAGGVGNGSTFGAETWSWDGAAWRQATPSAVPVGATTAAFDPSSGRVVAMAQQAAWEWTGTDWAVRAGGGHGPSVQPRLVSDGRRGRLLIHERARILARDGLPAAVVAYGSSCALGPAPCLAAIEPPRPDTAFAIELFARAPSVPTFLVLGFLAQNVSLGAGCRSLVAQPLAATFALADAGGLVRCPIAIPDEPSLRGVQLTAQGAVWNPPDSPLSSVTLTSGLQVTIGD